MVHSKPKQKIILTQLNNLNKNYFKNLYYTFNVMIYEAPRKIMLEKIKLSFYMFISNT